MAVTDMAVVGTTAAATLSEAVEAARREREARTSGRRAPWEGGRFRHHRIRHHRKWPRPEYGAAPTTSVVGVVISVEAVTDMAVAVTAAPTAATATKAATSGEAGRRLPWGTKNNDQELSVFEKMSIKPSLLNRETRFSILYLSSILTRLSC